MRTKRFFALVALMFAYALTVSSQSFYTDRVLKDIEIKNDLIKRKFRYAKCYPGDDFEYEIIHTFRVIYKGPWEKEYFANRSFLNDIFPEYKHMYSKKNSPEYITSEALIIDPLGIPFASVGGSTVYIYCYTAQMESTKWEADIYAKKKPKIVFYIYTSHGHISFMVSKNNELYVLDSVSLKLYTLDEFLETEWEIFCENPIKLRAYK